MIDKKRLALISALDISRRVETLGLVELGKYEQELDAFIKVAPLYEKTLMSTANNGNYFELSKTLKEICEILNGISANALASDGMAKVDKLSTMNDAVIEAYITYFTFALSSLVQEISNAVVMGVRAQVEHSAAGKTILAVDDASFFLNTLKNHLLGSPYNLVCVNSGGAALKFLEHNKPDLFILDIEMPDMNGYELAKMLRVGGHNAPIIFLTGNSTPDYVSKAVQAGASDFIVKPVSKEQMLEKIQKFI